VHVCSRLREDPTRMLLTHTEDDSAADLASRGCVLLVLFQKGAITPITVIFHLQLTVIDNPDKNSDIFGPSMGGPNKTRASTPPHTPAQEVRPFLNTHSESP
jgi:hypothetical protein